MSERWILNDLRNAVGQLEAALEVQPASDLVRAGCLQSGRVGTSFVPTLGLFFLGLRELGNG